MTNKGIKVQGTEGKDKYRLYYPGNTSNGDNNSERLYYVGEYDGLSGYDILTIDWGANNAQTWKITENSENYRITLNGSLGLYTSLIVKNVEEIRFKNGSWFAPILKTYLITTTASAINEGAILSTLAATTDVASGTTLYYSLSGTGINTADFSSGALTGSGTVASNGSFSFSHTIANDLTTEGTETLSIKLFSDSSLSTQVGSTASVGIVDSSITPVPVPMPILPTYALTPSATSINEGSTLTTSVATTNVASGTALYYSLSGTGINSSDFSSGALTGLGTVGSNGSFSFSHTLANDLTTEGTETLSIKLYSDSSRSTQVGSTASVAIADTSITPVIKNSGAAGFSISGKGDVGSQLSIIKTKDDPEGNGKFTYKWQSSVDGTNWTNLAATSSSYTIAAADASKQLRASISYLDGKSNSESVDTSAISIAAVVSTKLTAGDFATPVNINLSLPAYVMSTNWNIDKYYYYVEQYPMTLRTAFYADYLAGRSTNQALWGQNHYLTGGQAQGRSIPDTTGVFADTNDYGAYVENYGITLLDIYRKDPRVAENGGTLSLFAWGKEHYNTVGKAAGRDISGGVEWGGIVLNNLDLYNQWQDAKIANPTLSAFAFGYQRQNTIKSTLGVLVGSDTADKLTGQIAYGLNGNDVICSDGGKGVLAGGFGDDLLVAANGGSDLAYGGPGSDIFQLNAGSTFNIRDFRKGADMIQLGSTLTSSGVTMQWDSADNSTLFYNGSSIIGKVYGKRPTEFTYSDSTNGVSKVYI